MTTGTLQRQSSYATGATGPEAAPSPDELVGSHLPLVGYLVSELSGRLPLHVRHDDLRSAGFLALVQAARSFDAARGVPFARFASQRIRGAMIDELRSQDWASRSVRARARHRDEVEQELVSVLGRHPSQEEIAERMGVPVAQVRATEGDLHRSTVLSLQGFDGGAAVEELVLQTEDSPEDALLQRERTAYLVDAVRSLPERLRLVVEGLYYGERTIAELAAELGVTESRISQIRHQALDLLRDGMTAVLEPSALPAESRPEGCVARRRAAYFAALAAASSYGARLSVPAPRTGSSPVAIRQTA